MADPLTPIRLIDLDEPLAPVEFATGHVCPVRPLDAAGFELMRAIAAGAPDEDVLRLVQRVVTEASAADLASLTPTQAQAILAHARGALDELFRRRATEKNAAAPGTRPTGSRRSNRRTGSRT